MNYFIKKGSYFLLKMLNKGKFDAIILFLNSKNINEQYNKIKLKNKKIANFIKIS